MTSKTERELDSLCLGLSAIPIRSKYRYAVFSDDFKTLHFGQTAADYMDMGVTDGEDFLTFNQMTPTELALDLFGLKPPKEKDNLRLVEFRRIRGRWDWYLVEA